MTSYHKEEQSALLEPKLDRCNYKMKISLIIVTLATLIFARAEAQQQSPGMTLFGTQMTAEGTIKTFRLSGFKLTMAKTKDLSVFLFEFIDDDTGKELHDAVILGGKPPEVGPIIFNVSENFPVYAVWMPLMSRGELKKESLQIWLHNKSEVTEVSQDKFNQLVHSIAVREQKAKTTAP